MTDDLLAVGRIARAHGIHGEVAVQPLTEVESRFHPGSVVTLQDGRTLTVEQSRPHQQRVLVKFREIEDRTAAADLRGHLLLAAAADAPSIEEPDRFWVHQLVGADVRTENGRELGRIREVLSNPANDLWVLEDGRMLPAVHDVVAEVDVGAGRVVVRDVPGLTSGPAEEA